MKIYMLLPAYNEEEALLPLLERIDTELRSAGLPYRVVAVNDGSSDGSARVLDEPKQHYRIDAITHAYNRGLWLEALRAERDWSTIHMGSSGYHHPSDLVTTPVADGTRALAALHRGADGEVAFALRFGAEVELTPIVTEPAFELCQA